MRALVSGGVRVYREGGFRVLGVLERYIGEHVAVYKQFDCQVRIADPISSGFWLFFFLTQASGKFTHATTNFEILKY